MSQKAKGLWNYFAIITSIPPIGTKEHKMGEEVEVE